MSEFSDARYKRAVEELSLYTFTRIANTNGVSVRRRSAPHSVAYVVGRNGCTCSDYTARGFKAGEPCKHMIMVALTPLGRLFEEKLPEPPVTVGAGILPDALPEPSSQEIEAEAKRMAKEHNALWEDNKPASGFLVHARISLKKKSYRRAWFEKHASAWEEG